MTDTNVSTITLSVAVKDDRVTTHMATVIAESAGFEHRSAVKQEEALFSARNESFVAGFQVTKDKWFAMLAQKVGADNFAYELVSHLHMLLKLKPNTEVTQIERIEDPDHELGDLIFRFTLTIR